jgi:hypothetical protein
MQEVVVVKVRGTVTENVTVLVKNVDKVIPLKNNLRSCGSSSRLPLIISGR